MQRRQTIKSKNNVFTTLGASNHSRLNRVENDFYATSRYPVTKLLDNVKFNNNIWEVACGQGHISKILKEYGYFVKSTDLVDRGYGKGGVDFLNHDTRIHGNFKGDIATNPPYKLAKEFVEKAIEVVETGNKVAMLLRIQFLESKGRLSLFEKYPPKYIYVFSSRVIVSRNAEFDKYNTGTMMLSWFVWEKGYDGSPRVRFIESKDYK